MKKSYNSILMLILVIILAISAVSAADIDETSDLTVAEDDSTLMQVEDTSGDVQAASDEEVMADSGDGNNFTSLKTLINDASSSLTLNKDYTRVDGDSGIEINKDFTINGQDTYTIDANNLGGIFKVNSGYTLTLKGVTLINGDVNNGGAVYVENGATLNAENCKFNQNTAVYRGGAIYSEGTVDVKDSIFKNNDITYRTQNSDFGGAGIANVDGTLTVDNCEFSDNVKNYVIRGTDGKAGDLLDGAAILTSGDTKITNSDFFNNSACYGGAFTAIPMTTRKTATITIDNCNFTDNLAYTGAAMYIGWNADYDYTISNSWFENNLATGIGSTGYTAAGGAILSVYNSGSGSITKSTFKDNKVKDSTSTAGGAIKIEDTSSVTIEECVFDGNTADYIGGAVEVASGGHGASTVSIDKSNFTNNAAGYGGAVFSDSTTTLTVSNSLFEDNTATSGANSIYNMGDMTLTDNEFAADQDVFSTEIVSGTFTDLQDKINNAQGALDLTYDYAFVEGYDAAYANGVVIANPITINGNGYTISGSNAARIFNVTSGTLTLRDLSVTNGAASEGAAVYINSSAGLDATDVTFSDNVALDNGGAIYSDGGEISLENCVLDANDVTNLETSAAQNMGGAAIYAKNAQVTLVNTNVTNNGRSELDRSNGDLINAVINLINSDATITGGLFENNTGIYGGAIYAEGDGTQTLTVTGATFNNNKAYNGGAIDVDHGMITSISDSAFNNNLVVGPGSSGYYGAGGAIAVGGTGSFSLTNSNFTGNKATGVNATAGAVSIGLDQGCAAVIDDCEFKDNTAVLKGGAVFANSYNITISNSRFMGGNEAGTGNAIYNGGNLALSGNTISDESGIYTVNKIDTHVWVIVNDNQDAEVEYYDNIPIVLKITDDNGNIIRINEPTLMINLGSGLSLSKSLTLDEDTGFYTLDAYSVRQSGLLTPSRSTLVKYFNYNANNNLNSSRITMIKATPTVEVAYDNVENPSDVVINVTIIGKEGAPKISVSDTSSAPFKIVVNNETYKVKITNGVGSVTIPKLAVGNYVINASWNGNTNYKGIEPQLYDLLVSPKKGTFTDLQYIIDNDEFGLVFLPYDFKYDPNYDGDLTNGVVVNKNLYIIGNDYTIDANNSARIFNVTNGAIFKIDDATLTNGRADYGGAIYVDAESFLNPQNVVLYNNTATYRGGAIYSEGTVDVMDSVLDSNDITFRTKNGDNGGAAIYNLKGDLSISNSNITNNLKDIVIRNGNAGDLLVGVVVTSGYTFIEDSYFANNTGSWGGAISSLGYMNDESYLLSVKNSKFEGNNATFGGAIFVESSKLEVDNCTFENNKGLGVGSSGTSNTQGGAIIVHPAQSSVKITDSTFTGNSANVGAAVSLSRVDGDSIIENCTFTDNTASSEGGAIYGYTVGKLTVANSTFSGNTAPWGNAISNDGILVLSNNTVSGSSADIANYYGTIESEMNIVILNNETVTFSGEALITAKVTDDNNNIIKDINFVFVVNETQIDAVFNTTSGLYQAIYKNDAAGLYVVNITYNEEENLVVKTGTLKNIKGTFTELANMIANVETGKTIVLDGNYTYNPEFDADLIDGIVIDKDIAIDANGFTINGNDLARLFKVDSGKTFKLNNASLIKGNADSGSAIYNEGTAFISNSTFTGNVALDGTVIYNKGTLNETKNTIDQANAIYSTGKITSIVKAVYNDDVDIYCNAYDTIDFTVKFVDDNNNIIRFNVNSLRVYVGNKGTPFTTLTLDKTTGVYKGSTEAVTSGQIHLENLGRWFIDKGYVDNGNFKRNDAPQVFMEKANATLTVAYENISYPDDVVINVTLTGFEGRALDYPINIFASTFTITVNEKTTKVAISDSEGQLIVSDLPAGEYVIKVNFAGDKTYNPIEQSYNLTVGPKKGTFTELQYLIDNNEDETLVLPYDFKYDPDYDGNLIKGVVIDKAITIDGNGYTIDGKETARILQLNANGITIDNVTFINGHGDGESANFADWGGAIYSNGAYTNHIISNSRFYNNTAYNGGAIYLAGDDSKIINSSFEDNIAFASGGAVFLYGWDCTIEGSNFTGNIAMELGGAVAMFSSHPVIIRESTFTKNIAGQNGGAVSWQKAAGSIFESTFTENEAGANGGAVFWGADAGSVAGGEFTGNSAEGFGGAIFVNEDAGLTIASTFAENSALNGGAIAALGDTTVYSSTFTENAADDFGGAVFVNDGAKLNIKQSTIKDNTATFGKSIYVLNGTVDSTIVRATILDNKTWDAALDDNYVLNATLTDDNGNDIYDPSFRFVVDDVVIDVEPLYNEQTGLYSLSYTVDSAGLNVVSTNYDAENLEILTGILDVPKVKVTEFSVIAVDTLEGKNATVWLTLKANETGLNSPVTVIINNKEYLVNVENGEGNITIEALDHGQYPVVAILDNPNYENAINSTVFFVKGQAKLNVTELTVAEYGDVIEIAINLTDSQGKPLTGVVVVDEVINILVENGIGTFVIDNQPDVDNYTFQAVYDGDNDYFGDLAIFNVTVNTKVIDPEDIVVDIPNINEFDEAIPITITSPVDGIYTVNINGTPVEVEVVNGVGNATITLDKPGIYNATVDIAEEGYSLETITTDEFEYLVTPEFNVEITGTYPEAEISITGPAGTYHVIIDGMEPVDITREESGLPTTTKISNMDAGNYTAFVSFDARDEYYGDYKEINFTVNKAALDIAEPEVIGDKVVESPINITFTLPTDVDPSSVSAFIDGTPVPIDEFVINETTGVYTLPLDGFSDAVGHLFTVEVNDPNYEENGAQVSFLIEKAEITVTIEVDGDLGVMGGATVNVTVSKKANGNISIDNNGVVSVVEITNGTYSFEIYDLQAGEYYINVTFLGNDKYLKSNATKVLNIPKSAATPEITDVTAEITLGEYGSILVEMDQDFATGNITVFVDGVENQTVVLEEDYPAAIVLIPGLTIGDHTIGVRYNGDDNYDVSGIVNTTINVVQAESKVTIDSIDNVIYGEDVYITYAVENQTDVVITVYDNTGEISPEMDDADGIIAIKGLAPGDYQIMIENKENDEYKYSYEMGYFTVGKAESNVIIDPIDNVTYGEEVMILYTVENKTDVNIIVYRADEIIEPEIETEDGIITIKGLTPGNYQIFIENQESDKYKYSFDMAYFTVGKAASSVTIVEIDDLVYPGSGEVLYEIENETEKLIILTFNGVEIQVPYDNESVQLTDLAAGEYTLTIVNIEDDLYNESEASISFKVLKADPTFTSEVDADAKVGENVTITVIAPVDATGNVSLAVDGELVAIDVPVVDGTAIINVTGLAAGHHSYDVTFAGDDNYNSATDLNSFDVAKAETTVTIEVDEYAIGVMGSPIVNITVSNNVTGYIAIDNDGTVSVVEIVNGTYSYQITDLTAGDYYINVTFLGNDNYLKSNATKEFNVPKSAATPIVNVTTPEIKGGEAAELNITMDNEFATGYVRIYIDGVDSGLVQLDDDYANATVPVSDLTDGTHTIGVKYIGNDNFDESDIVNVTVTVVKADSKVIIDPITNVTYGTPVVVFYTIENRTGNVTVSICYNDGELQPPVEDVDYVIEDDRITINGLDTGDYVVIIFNNEDKYYNDDSDSGLFTVNKIDIADKITIEPATITYGENATVIVSGFPEDATGTVTITIADKDYTVDVEDGDAIVEILGLAAGTYEDVAVEYSGDDIYNATNARCAVYVEKAKSEVTIYAIGDQTYPGEFSIGYDIENKTDVVITINGPEGEEVPYIIDDEGKIVLTDLVAGEYYITIENMENENYTGSEAEDVFKVLKADPTFTSNVTENAKVGENITITVKAPADATGNVTVSVDGEIVAIDIPVIDGAASINVTDLAAGHHSYEVTYNGDDNYKIASDLNSFDVVKVDPKIVIDDIENAVVGNTVKTNVTVADGNATGYVIYNNVAYKLENGKAIIDVGISEAGMQTIAVEYLGDDKYSNFTGNKAFNAAKAATTIELDFEEITEVLGRDVDIEYIIDPMVGEGNVSVWINDEFYSTEEIYLYSGYVTIKAEDLPTNGTYTVKVQYIGTKDYEDSNVAEVVLNITEEHVDIDINIPENTTTPVFNITVPTDATGLLLVDIDGKHYYAPIENGTASITVPGLEPGNYTANVTYSGDDFYDPVTETVNITIPANADENSITIPEGATITNPTFSIDLPSDATGYFEVDVDGKKYVVPVENGKASISVPGLAPGSHNVTVKYSGDSKYNSISKSTTLNLNEPVPILSENNDITVVYSGKSTYKVRLTLDGKAAAGKVVTINFNGKNYNVKTDSKGYATLNINAVVKPKTYTVTATYKGVKVTNKVNVKHVIKAKNKKAKKSKKLKLVVKLNKVDGKVLKNKKVKLKFKGKKYTAKTNKKGKAKFTIKKNVMNKLKKGKKYKYKVYYGKDKVTKKIKVKK